jgi:uncharacterized coiled-coil DUF342 family protein
VDRSPENLTNPRSDRDELKTEVTALAAERDGLKTQVTSLTTERDGLTARVTTLTGQVSSLTSERDSARQQLATSQASVAGALSTMSGPQLWALFPTIAGRYTSSVWSNSYFSSGPD